MSLHGTYDDNNIFAKIIRGEMPCMSVFEDDVALAFMDVFPQSEGHTLVIPKRMKVRNFLEASEDDVMSLMKRVHSVAHAVEKALKPDGIQIVQYNGAPAGQTVFHLHFHIIPRYENAEMKSHASGEMATQDVLKPIAYKIRDAF
jgi:histidine triad (HIT) family protein